MQPFAIWDSARDVWEIPQTEGFFCEHLDVFLATFPTSGMTVNGVAYELPTWEPATDGSAYSSLLPTVTVSDTNGAGVHGDGGLDLRTTVSLLPTTRAQHGEDRNNNIYPRPLDQPQNLENSLARLLPTPTVGMMLGGSQTRSGARNGEKLLPGVAKDLALLPTPAAIDGNGTGNAQSLDALKTGGRQLHTTDIPSLLDLSIGETTPQPSDTGSAPLDGQLRGQLNLLDAITDTD